jgi:hypothetical protein
LQVFFVDAVVWCVCFVPDRNRTGGKPAVHSTRRKRLFAGTSGSFEPLTSCEGSAEGHEFDPSGESGFSPESGVSASGPTDLQTNVLLTEQEPGAASPRSPRRLLVVHSDSRAGVRAPSLREDGSAH